MNERFMNARLLVLSESGESGGIGRLAEKSLHKTLKYYIEPNAEYHEVKFLGSVADIMRDGAIYEIQTRGCEKLRAKLLKFLANAKVTVVLPLCENKSVAWIDKETGEILKSHKSPKKEGLFDAIFELSKIREFLSNSNFSVKLIFLDVSEYRYLDGWDKSGKRGSTRLERIPNKLLSEIDIKDKSDIALLLPFSKGEEFSAKELARKTKMRGRKNYYVLRFLLDTGIIEKSREEGRAFIYRFLG